MRYGNSLFQNTSKLRLIWKSQGFVSGVSGLSWCCKPHRERSTDLLMLLRFWVRVGCSPSGLPCSWSECTLESSSSGNSKNLLDQHKRYGSLPGAHNRWEHPLVGGEVCDGYSSKCNVFPLSMQIWLLALDGKCGVLVHLATQIMSLCKSHRNDHLGCC